VIVVMVLTTGSEYRICEQKNFIPNFIPKSHKCSEIRQTHSRRNAELGKGE
jgi:hypothetical protein